MYDSQLGEAIFSHEYYIHDKVIYCGVILNDDE